MRKCASVMLVMLGYRSDAWKSSKDLNRDQTSPRCRDRPVELITDGAEGMKQLDPCWFEDLRFRLGHARGEMRG